MSGLPNSVSILDVTRLANTRGTYLFHVHNPSVRHFFKIDADTHALYSALRSRTTYCERENRVFNVNKKHLMYMLVLTKEELETCLLTLVEKGLLKMVEGQPIIQEWAKVAKQKYGTEFHDIIRGLEAEGTNVVRHNETPQLKE